jgi:hypothetical protein
VLLFDSIHFDDAIVMELDEAKPKNKAFGHYISNSWVGKPLYVVLSLVLAPGTAGRNC